MNLPSDVEPDALSLAQGLWLGTSSWTFEGWRGVFYPDGVKREDYLATYAQQFPAVEVNTTFYGLPAPSTLIRWVESVPTGFRFALKFPREITHERRLIDASGPTLQFFDVIDALGDAAGPALLQLPPTLSRARDGRALADYLDWLATVQDGRGIAVEVRAPDLMTKAFARFVHERGLTLALVDRIDTPDLFDVWQSVSDRTTFAFIRWIGDDRNGPKGDSELVAPRDEKLVLWAGRIQTMLAQGQSVYGFMHNPYEGHAPASVRRLMNHLVKLEIDVTWSPPPMPLPSEDKGDETDDGENDLGQQMRLL